MTKTEEYITAGFIMTLGQRVYASATNDDYWAASVEIWRTLSRSEQYTLGVWALVEAERRSFTRHRPTIQESGSSLSRRAIGNMNRNPLDHIMAVANTGIRKNIGSLTHEDLETIADYYGTHKRAYAEKEEKWRIIASKVPAGKTVADVWVGISAASTAFLLIEAHIVMTEDDVNPVMSTR